MGKEWDNIPLFISPMAKITGESCELPAGGANPPECGAMSPSPFSKVAQRVARPINAEQARESPRVSSVGAPLDSRAPRPAAPHERLILCHGKDRKGKPIQFSYIAVGFGKGWPPDQDYLHRR